MAQIFHRSANTLARVSIIAVVVIVSVLGFAAWEIQRSPWVTWQGIEQVQPVPFSHQHHNAGLGIDCRYCHTSVETSSYAGNSADQDVHELPPADLDQRSHAGTGPRELSHRQVD